MCLCANQELGSQGSCLPPCPACGSAICHSPHLSLLGVDKGATLSLALPAGACECLTLAFGISPLEGEELCEQERDANMKASPCLEKSQTGPTDATWSLTGSGSDLRQ